MTVRNVNAKIAVNDNVIKYRSIDLNVLGEASENGTVPSAVQATCVATEYGNNAFHRTLLTCTALPLSIADDAGTAQYGGVKVYTFPIGLIKPHAARVEGNLTLGVTGTIIAAFTGVNALGSITASTGSSLTSTEATWLASTANATASASVAAISSISAATVTPYDGRSTAGAVFLNFAIADDATHTAGTGTFTGTIVLSWSKL